LSTAKEVLRKRSMSPKPGTLVLNLVSNGVARLAAGTREVVKNALIIVAVVAGYSLLEAGALLSVMLPHLGYPNRWAYSAVVAWGQLLVIPGLAALLSRIMYGSYHWGRRAAMILLVGSFGVPVVLTLIFIPVGLLVWAYSISKVIFVVILPVLVGVVILSLRFVIRRGAKWSVQLESRRWLTERESGIDPRERKWRSRGIRLAPWIPVLIVLLVFLFLPEIGGILSQVSSVRPASLLGYRVPIPRTWIVRSRWDEQETGRSWVAGWASRGIAFGVRPYLRMRAPLSSWDIRTTPYLQSEENATDRRVPKDSEVIGSRVLRVGSESVTCLDYWPSYVSRPEHVETSPLAYVECAGTRLRAGFDGQRNQVATFYRMLEGTTQAN
jgi:hypothetical protein